MSKSKKKEGFGWGGVYRICHNLKKRLELVGMAGVPFDLLIIHVDGDVAQKKYSDIGEKVTSNAVTNTQPEDPPALQCTQLGQSIERWLTGQNEPIVLCLPYVCTETWAGGWQYPDWWEKINEASKESEVYALLDKLGRGKAGKGSRLVYLKDGKYKKVMKNYQLLANCVTEALWKETVAHCGQAGKFESDFKRVL